MPPNRVTAKMRNASDTSWQLNTLAALSNNFISLKECCLQGCYIVCLLEVPMFRRNCLLHHQGDKNQKYVSPESLLQEPYSVTSQKTAFFIVTAVKTSNLSFLSIKMTSRLFFLHAVKQLWEDMTHYWTTTLIRVYDTESNNPFILLAWWSQYRSTIWGEAVLVFLIEVIYELYRPHGLRWHGIHTSFHENPFGNQVILKLSPQLVQWLLCWYLYGRGFFKVTTDTVLGWMIYIHILILIGCFLRERLRVLLQEYVNVQGLYL
jgi:hypothetical protein